MEDEFTYPVEAYPEWEVAVTYDGPFTRTLTIRPAGDTFPEQLLTTDVIRAVHVTPANLEANRRMNSDARLVREDTPTLLRIAARYVDLTQRTAHPNPILAAEFDLSTTQIRDRLRAARVAGLLTHPGSTAAGGHLTEKALQMMRIAP